MSSPFLVCYLVYGTPSFVTAKRLLILGGILPLRSWIPTPNISSVYVEAAVHRQ